MPAGSFRGRPAPAPVKKLCKKCGSRSGKAAVSGREHCKSCLAQLPSTRNSQNPRHPRQHG